MKEKILETKICRHCSSKFEITDKDLEFYEKVSPVFSSTSPSDIPLNWGGTKGGVLSLWDGNIKYLIPVPTLCPDCRQQRRLAWRSERKLYKRKCDFSGKDIISIYSPDKPYKVYDQEIWWSDSWDVMDYGRDFDFNRSFFSQFDDLLKAVPKRALVKWNWSENCDYVNGVWWSKNCYLIFECSNDEDCYYSKNLNFSKDCVDCNSTNNSIWCYELVDCNNCYNCYFSQNSADCKTSSYLYNCKNCENCFCCVNLENTSYCIFNKKYEKEEYYKLLKNTNTSEILSNFSQFKLIFPHLNCIIINSENAIWDIIYNSKNIYQSYEISDSSDVRYSSIVYWWSNDSFDTYVSINWSQKVFESCVINKHCFWVFYCSDCWNECKNIFYCTECKNIQNCFWCHGLCDKSYCILNKQYLKEEYEKLVPRIISHMMTPPQSPSIEGEARNEQGEWWEFFPASISPFGYNETVAQEYYPLENSELSVISQEIDTFKVWKLKTGNWKLKINWSDYEAPFPKVDKIIPASKLPSNIAEIPDDILNWAIEDEERKTMGLNPLFRIIPQELEFYRKHNLPIPKKHPDQRHLDRMALRNPRKLFSRICDKCGKDIKTTYAPERPEIVYCQDCYEKEIY